MAYELVLPPDLQHIHNAFNVSMLRKYNPKTSHVVENEMVEIQPDLSYVVKSIEVKDWMEKVLRSKAIPLIRVLWINRKWTNQLGN